MRWRRPLAAVLALVVLALVPGIAASETMNVTVSKGGAIPNNIKFVAPNKDLAVVELPFDIKDLLGYTYLEVKGNQSYNIALIEPGEKGFAGVGVDKLRNHTIMDASGAAPELSRIIESFVQENFSSLASQLEDKDLT